MNSKCGVQSKRRCESHNVLRLYCWIWWCYPFSSRFDVILSHMNLNKGLQPFRAHFEHISTEVVYLLCCLVVTGLVLRETAAVLTHSAYTIRPCTMSRHCERHICGVHACLAVTCYQHYPFECRRMTGCFLHPSPANPCWCQRILH